MLGTIVINPSLLFADPLLVPLLPVIDQYFYILADM